MAETVIYPLSDETGQSIVTQLALIASNVSYTLPEATTSTLGGVRYDGETIMKNDDGQLYVAYVDVSDQVEALQAQVTALASMVVALQERVDELSGETTDSVNGSVSGDYLNLTGANVSVADDYLTITSSDASVADDYLTLGSSSSSSSSVSDDELNLTGSNVSVTSDYLNIVSTDASVTDDVLDL